MANIFSTFFNPQESKDYRSGMNQAETSLNNQSEINKQYTGNQGYQNSIQQGLTGANVTAGQAGQQAQKAARNSGMSKSAAAALGSSNAANAYGTNFANQQNAALNTGNMAVNANQNLTGQYLNKAGLGLNQQNQKYGQAASTIGTIGNMIGNVGGLLDTALSDERMKNIQDTATNLSKAIENIDLYKYEYTDEAKEAYPNEAKDGEKVGIMAQELESNPITESSVVEDENGIKHVDTNQLIMQAIGLIADLSRRVSDIENN